jgi:glycosyltransferase involved in cell wall biosynthesis
LAGYLGRLFLERQRGRHELPICERLLLYAGRNSVCPECESRWIARAERVMTIAYLANSFPESVEPYVWEEICELRERNQRVVPCSMRRPKISVLPQAVLETEYVFPLRARLCLMAVVACLTNLFRIRAFLARAIRGPEPLSKRLHAIAHTYLGVYLAILLRDKNVKHIHVHHGFFSSWIGMVAAQVLGAGFSMTLHGSDLLVRADYLDIKLEQCKFCITISDFNRRHILQAFPRIDASKVVVQRLGIQIAEWRLHELVPPQREPIILSVGRLHDVKNYQFLVLACRALKSSAQPFRCFIAGDGPARTKLEQLVEALDLREHVNFLGYVPREGLPDLYAQSDVVALTSRSEGIPVTLIEAMAMEKLVLAPRITGIPELVEDGKTGFLYRPNSMEEFLHKMQFILHVGPSLDGIRKAARRHIEANFNQAVNLQAFARTFLERTSPVRKPVLVPFRGEHEDPVLQQIQLSL